MPVYQWVGRNRKDEGQKGEIEGHELDHRATSRHGGPDAQTGEAQLADG